MKGFSALLFLPLLISAQALQGGVPQIACPQDKSLFGEPAVSSEETAKAIFLAVEAGRKSAAPDTGNYPDVIASDAGEYWEVSRGTAPGPLANGDIAAALGGGQLSLRIAKCDGAYPMHPISDEAKAFASP